MAPFAKKIVSRCFTEAENQNLNHQVRTVARKNSLLPGGNLKQDPAYKEEPFFSILQAHLEVETGGEPHLKIPVEEYSTPPLYRLPPEATSSGWTNRSKPQM